MNELQHFMLMNTKIAEHVLKSRIDTIKSWSRKSYRIPGLIFILFLILKNPFISCTNPNSSFYNKILNDFDTTSYFIALDIKLSLIHISEPTRRTPISYAVFCLKKK